MNRLLPLLLAAGVTALRAGDPSLTIYNQNFAVVRDTVPVDLKPGENDVEFRDATYHLEPDSVVLRDPSGKAPFQVLEQNYRNDPISQGRLLALYEGKWIDFLQHETNKLDRIVQGRIVRSGYTPHSWSAMQRYGGAYYQSQAAYASPESVGQPIIEVEGKLRFSLPGEPLFPPLANDAILKPTIQWRIASGAPAKLDAELSYVTGGLSWQADYNVVAPEKGDQLSLTGWVTMDNQSGKTFANAQIKLMAGDVKKVQEVSDTLASPAEAIDALQAPPHVNEKTFDEYHLYALPRPTTLYDRETKQVEFLQADDVSANRLYLYNGAKLDGQRWRGYNVESIRNQPEYGIESNSKVWVMSEIKNSEANHLGMPLPRGKVRLYRRDGNQLEFIGENVIDHTPKDETLRIYTGNAFDLSGERKRTKFKIDSPEHSADEAFEIRLRNHKKEPVEVRVVERLYRGANWQVARSSEAFSKIEAQTIEFRVPVKPNQEQVLTYEVHYNW